MDKYGFLMIRYETPEFIKDIHNKIPKEDLYIPNNKDEKFSYGIEEDTHVTMAACLDNDIDLEKLKSLLKPLEEYTILLTNISKFSNDKYDVLKSDVASIVLFQTNTEITKNFESHSEYKEYHPHMTIAYVKCGTGDKFLKEPLDNLVYLKPKEFHFSYYDKNGKEKHETWK